MRAFIVRPFDVKEGIDFERVEKELIQPALARLSTMGFPVTGGTTGEISRQGNIREDMFRALVVADLVIADVSIHNANAFYELGIRHALRPRATFLIRSKSPHAYPFDLQTDRYFLYDAAKPAGDEDRAIESLAAALRSTLASEGVNSPVFQLLPHLKPHGRTQLVKVPASFSEEVDKAKSSRQLGHLRLLAQEVTSFDWDQEGLRLVGEAQFALRANAGARETFELLRSASPDDFQANRRLGTIYQRLGTLSSTALREDQLKLSDQAVNRALRAAPTAGDRAEAFALLGSNEKTRWIREFMSAPQERRLSVAMSSPRLLSMLRYYLKGVSADMNAHYPAINALALLKAQLEYAARCPDDWLLGYETDEEARVDLEFRKRCASRLESALALVLEKDPIVGRRDGDSDPWAESSRADLLMLTVRGRPGLVGHMYRRVLADADRFTIEATLRNLRVFRDLGFFEANVAEALKAAEEAEVAEQHRRAELAKHAADAKQAETAAQADGSGPGKSSADANPERVILFTGHMVDAPERSKDQARFPSTVAAEAIARKLIEDAVCAELAGVDSKRVLGISGGAAGSDILFHEVCDAVGIRTELLLALPEDQYLVTSVQRGGPAWVDRYQRLCLRTPPRALQQSEAVPTWLVD
jgi:hypothetical protein